MKVLGSRASRNKSMVFGNLIAHWLGYNTHTVHEGSGYIQKKCRKYEYFKSIREKQYFKSQVLHETIIL